MRPFPSGRAILAILGVALLCAVGCAFLPSERFQRWHQMDRTLYGSLGWTYDRIHNDPAPIDVAFVGASRTLLAVSAPRLEADLAARGVPAKVANFGVIGNGRNINWSIVEELLSAKRPKLLVVEVTESRYRYGHPAFQYVAPSAEILKPPVLGLHDWGYQLLYLPYRNLQLLGASMFPKTFGIAREFDPKTYRGTTVETTTSFHLPTGRYIEMGKEIPEAKLLAGTRAYERGKSGRSRLPQAVTARIYGDDDAYVQLIVDAARAHKVPVMFLYLPYYSGPKEVTGKDFYEARGKLLEAAFVRDQHRLYQGWAHLNHNGALVMTDWLADRIAPELAAKPN